MTLGVLLGLRAKLSAFLSTHAGGIARGVLTTLPLLGLWLLFVVTGLWGVDYGFHWDEADWHFWPVHEMVASGVLLPKSYIYPMLTKWLVLLPSLPAGIAAGFAEGADTEHVQAAMLAKIDAPEYLFEVRRLFIFVSSLAIVWTYGAALALRYSWWQALLAAAGVGLSWEFAYHARYVNTDCVLVQFSALTLFGVALYLRTQRRSWLYASAVFAGLGTGTKYSGVFLLVTVVLTVAFTAPPRKLFAKSWRMVEVCAIAFAVYLVTTPATVLDPFAFFDQSRFISAYYANVKHGGYTVSSSLEHVKTLFLYFAVSYFSPYHVTAILTFGAALAGIGLWFRKEWRPALLLLVGPVSFLVLFCANYLMVTVRNYLFIVPALSLFLASAARELDERVRCRWLRWSLGAITGLVLLSNAAWLVRAAKSIRHVDPKAYVKEALAFVSEHPARSYRVSPRVRELAQEQRLAIPANVTTGAKTDAVVFFARSEGAAEDLWTTNDPWLTEAVFGPLEVNFNYYSTWAGHDRVVVMTLEKARAAGAPIAK